MCTLVIPEPTGTWPLIFLLRYLYLLWETLYFHYPDCDMQFRLKLYMYWSSFVRHPVPSSDRWKGQIDSWLTSCCVVKISALKRISSCSPDSPIKDQSDLWLSMSFTQDNNGTLLWSRRLWEQGLPTIALNEHETAMISLFIPLLILSCAFEHFMEFAHYKCYYYYYYY